MEITDEMLQAAVSKAIEAGLLPRNACRVSAEESKEMMRLIVQAAMSANPRSKFPKHRVRARRRIEAGFGGATDVKLAIPAYACT